MSELSILAEKENNRILNILTDCGVKESKIESLKPIIENVAWMKVKLDDAREAVKTSNVAIPYDNGGNQKGIRVNPLFTGYESLWKSYMAGMEKIFACLPAEVVKEEVAVIEQPKTMLELIKAKHKKEA